LLCTDLCVGAFHILLSTYLCIQCASLHSHQDCRSFNFSAHI
jgi:hypothetical protein